MVFLYPLFCLHADIKVLSEKTVAACKTMYTDFPVNLYVQILNAWESFHL